MDQRLYRNFTRDFVPFGINKFTTPEEKTLLRTLANLYKVNLKNIDIQMRAIVQLLNHLDYHKISDLDLAINSYFYHYYEVLEKFKNYDEFYNIQDFAYELY